MKCIFRYLILYNLFLLYREITSVRTIFPYFMVSHVKNIIVIAD